MGITLGIVGIIVVIAAVIAIAVAVEQSTHTFVCRDCGKEFKPKWTQLVFEVHMLDEHVMKCPFCNKKGFCGDKGKI